MRHTTHVITSAGLSVFVFSFIPFFSNISVLLIITAIGLAFGGFNDYLDFIVFKNLEHRAWITHSLLSPIFLSGLAVIVLSIIYLLPMLFMVAIIFAMSWILHVILDACTFSGVQILIPGFAVSGKIHYKNPLWNWIFVGSAIGLWVLGMVISLIISQ